MAKGRPKGSPRTPGSGRTKGSPNKATVELEERAAALGCDPFKVLCLFTNGDWEGLGYPTETVTRVGKGGEVYEVERVTPDHRLKAASEASQYLYAKRKALEVTKESTSVVKIESLSATDLKAITAQDPLLEKK